MASSSKSSSEPVAPPAQPGLASTLSLVQAASGISFLGFAVVHFAGHSLVPFVGSIANADKVMSVLRTWYQHPVLEPLLVPASLAVHISAGLGKAYLRSKQDHAAQPSTETPATGSFLSRFDTWSRDWQRTSGYLLALLVPLHAIATRGAALMYLDDSKNMSYSYPLATLIFLPQYFLPYYTLLLSIPGAYHAFFGLRYALTYLHSKYKSLPSLSDTNARSLARTFAFGMTACVLTMFGWAHGWVGPTVNREVEFDLPRWRKLWLDMYGMKV